MTDYGSATFAALRAGNAASWAAYTRHPFVAALGAGDLPRDAFLRYLVQDYRFLIHFARAWALLAAKSDDIETVRAAAAIALNLIDDELQLHVQVCAAAGIDRATLDAADEAPATLAYTRFVIDRGLAGDELELLVALSPCVLGYGEIGARLARERRADTPFAPWIETYASDDYQALCARNAAMLERAVARRIGARPEAAPRWSALSRTFGTACRLETAFWEAAL